MKKNVLLVLLMILFVWANAQVTGETPLSWELGWKDSDVPLILSPALDMDIVKADDERRASEGLVPHFAKFVPANYNLNNSGVWRQLDNGDRVWRLRIEAEDALGEVLYFNDFYLPEGAKFFIYSDDHVDVFGAYTSLNNQSDRLYASSLLLSRECILEYYEPASVRNQGSISVEYVSHAYRFVESRVKKDETIDKSAGSCNVNARCTPESSSYTDQVHSVVRLLTSASGGSAFCTGSLVNNVRSDCRPFFLTANHCLDTDAASSYSTLTVQFNYESATCSGSTPISTSNIVTGATFRARSGGSSVSASDFNLFEMNSAIPTSYGAYFAGWDASGTASPNGVTIHHPSGDIKKISTYSATTTLTTYSGGTGTTHWKAIWVPTTNGTGITEPGSSGSPLFNNVGRIMGDLSGGPSYCGVSASNRYDYYGSFTYSWLNNGATLNSRKLKPWLDPDNTGTLSIGGTYAPCSGFTLAAANDTLVLCQTDTNAMSISVSISGSSTVGLSLSGMPSGVSYAFSPSSLTSSGTSNLSIYTAGTSPGVYTLTVTGTDGTASNTTTFYLSVSAASPSVLLLAPANGMSPTSLTPTLSWSPGVSGAYSYQVQVSTDSSFVTTDVNVSGISATSYNIPVSLTDNTWYYWRVRVSGMCGDGPYSSVRKFKTGFILCQDVFASGLPANIPDNSSVGLSSVINFTGSGIIQDVNVIDLSGTHTYMSDLTFTLSSPTGTTVTLFDGICGSNNNFNMDLDDEATSAIPCPPTDGAVHLPENSLSAFDNVSPAGNWTLRIYDNASSDVGALSSWGLHICYLTEFSCNLSANMSVSDVNCFGGNDGNASITVSGATMPISYDWSNGTHGSSISGLTAGTYYVTVTDANACQLLDTVVIAQPPVALSATASSTPSGGADGSAWAVPTGGTSPYSYSWNTGLADSLIDHLNVGTYSCTITDAKGCTFNLSVDVAQDTTIGINNIEGLNYFNLYPTVGSNYTNIAVSLDKEYQNELIITDMQGKLIDSKYFTAQAIYFQIDISEWSNGIYFVKLKNDSGYAVKKLIKQ